MNTLFIVLIVLGGLHFVCSLNRSSRIEQRLGVDGAERFRQHHEVCCMLALLGMCILHVAKP